jgi:hypothetical protein
MPSVQRSKKPSSLYGSSFAAGCSSMWLVISSNDPGFARVRLLSGIELRFALRRGDCDEAFAANRIHRAIRVLAMRELRVLDHF